MKLHALKGRLIAQIIAIDETTRHSGIIIINRKDVPVRAKVIAVGDPSIDRFTKKTLFSPAQIDDIIHFKKYKPHFHQSDAAGAKKGFCTVWWSDIVAVENDNILSAPMDMVIVKLVLKEVSQHIIIPQTHEKQHKAFYGEVCSIGPLYPANILKISDNIIFPRHEGVPITYKEKEYLSLQQRWVHAKMLG